MYSSANARAIAGALVAILSCWSGVVEAKNGFRVLYNFNGTPDGSIPYGGLLRAKDGNLYGTTFGGGTAGEGTVFQLSPDGAETVLHSFAGGATDGAEPLDELVTDQAGNLYGTTQIGGPNDAGVLFKVALNHTESVLHFFTDTPDGAIGFAGLVEGVDGNLYGGTVGGGTFGNGTIFRSTPSGSLTVLYNFTGNEGFGPTHSLILNRSGNLYGTSDGSGPLGHGTVYKLTPEGTLNTLYAFSGGGDGGEPELSLIRDKSGNLYGTTQARGIPNCAYGWGGCGVVFKLAPDGTKSTLHSFTGGQDGGQPFAGLIMDEAGNLYGTTVNGGSKKCNNGCGVVFKIAPDGTETTLHKFTGSDGSNPGARLIADGHKKFRHLYGTARHGGTSGHGVIFEIKLKS